MAIFGNGRFGAEWTEKGPRNLSCGGRGPDGRVACFCYTVEEGGEYCICGMYAEGHYVKIQVLWLRAGAATLVAKSRSLRRCHLRPVNWPQMATKLTNARSLEIYFLFISMCWEEVGKYIKALCWNNHEQIMEGGAFPNMGHRNHSWERIPQLPPLMNRSPPFAGVDAELAVHLWVQLWTVEELVTAPWMTGSWGRRSCWQWTASTDMMVCSWPMQTQWLEWSACPSSWRIVCPWSPPSQVSLPADVSKAVPTGWGQRPQGRELWFKWCESLTTMRYCACESLTTMRYSYATR